MADYTLLKWSNISETTGLAELIRILNRRKVKVPTDTSLLIHIDGGGSAITTGEKLDVPFHEFGARITGWTLVADTSGSIVIDLWKDSYGNYPPTDADTITGGDEPELSSATKNTADSVPTWNTVIQKGETLRVNVDSASTVTRVTLALGLEKT